MIPSVDGYGWLTIVLWAILWTVLVALWLRARSRGWPYDE